MIEKKQVTRIKKTNFRDRFKICLGDFINKNKKLRQMGMIKIAAEILVAIPMAETRPDRKSVVIFCGLSQNKNER